MLTDIFKKGSTDKQVSVTAVDATTGLPKTAVAYDDSGAAFWYKREGGTKTTVTLASLATTDAAHADGGFIHIGDGKCRLDLPDAAFAGGASYVEYGGSFTGTLIIGGRVKLIDIDLEDAGDMGVTALTGHTPQTGDSYAIVNDGAHGNAALKTLVETADTVVDAIKAVTDNLPNSGALNNLDAAISTRMPTSHIAATAGKVDAVGTVDTCTTNTDMRGTDGAVTSIGTVSANVVEVLGTSVTESAGGQAAGALSYFFDVATPAKTVNDVGVSGSGLTQEDVRTAVGLASANLDTQLGAINSKTTNLPSDPADQSDLVAAVAALESHGDATWATASGFSTFDPATDTVANVTLVGTCTTNTDMRGTDGAYTGTPPSTSAIASAILAASVPESYPTAGSAPTLGQAVMAVLQYLIESAISGTTHTIYQRDGVTPAYTLTLNDATTPTGKSQD